MERIVVGIDGSDGSRRALAWAVAEARLHGAQLECVMAWELPIVAAAYPTDAGFDAVSLELDAADRLHEVVASVDTTGLRSPVDERLEKGVASSVLLEAAKGADVLVVGSRGLGGFKGLLVGSVSNQVVHHASCTVVVVPPA